MAFPLDSLFQCLAKRRRRIVLSYLLTIEDRPVTIDELVDAVIKAESYLSLPSSSSDPESVAITLDHVHLPLLADTGLIKYDRERGTVTTTNRTTHVEPYLDGVQNADRVDGSTGEERETMND